MSELRPGIIVFEEEGEVTRELFERLTAVESHTGRIVSISFPCAGREWLKKWFIEKERINEAGESAARRR